jgi:superoxide reductase
MAHRLEICKCYVCGNVVEVVHSGEGVLMCCGRQMSVFSEKTVDPEQEEYYPVVQRTADGVKVTVGSDKYHDMEDDHHIQWIEVIADGLVYRRFFKPKEPPEAVFKIDAESLRARAYCTQHGLCVERKAK